MDCKHCGTPNPEGAVFCMECGKRLDGMQVCPSCGKLVADEGKFCPFCGQRLAQPQTEMPRAPLYAASQVPPAPTQAASLPALPQTQAYRAPAQPRPAADGWSAPAQPSGYGSPYYGAPAARPARQRMPAERLKGILKTVADGLAAFGALLAFVFVFLIGGNLTGYIPDGSPDGIQSSIFPLLQGDWNIFSCFGDSYSAMADAAEAFGTNSFVKYAYDINAALSIVIAALTLAGVAACFIFAAVRYVRVLTHKTEKSVFGPAMATFVVFVAGACLLGALMAERVYMATADYSAATVEEFEVVANGATVAGIVLGAIAVLAAMAMNAVIKAHSCGARSLVLNGVGGGLIAAFALVAIGVASGGYFGYGVSANGVGTSVSYGIYSFMESIATGSLSDDRNYVDMFNGEQAIIIIMVFVAIIFAALAVCALASLLDLAAVKSRRTLVFTYSAGACGIVLGVLQLVSSSIYFDWLSVSATLSVTVPVVIMVFSALMIIGAGVYTVLSRKYAAEPVAAEA